VTKRLEANLLFALLCWIWGSTWLAIKVGLADVPPLVGASVRMTLSGVALLLVAYALRLEWPRRRSYWWQIPLQGTCQFGLNFALVYWAELTVPSGLAAVLFAISPLVTSLSATLIFRMERLTAANVIGLLVGLAGVGVIYWSEVLRAADVPALGVFAVLTASTIVSLASVAAKRFGEGIPPLALVAPGQLFGGLLLGAIALFTERGLPIHFTASAVGSIAYLAVLGSAVAFMAYFYLLRSIDVTRLSLLSYVTPVVAVTLGALVLHERLEVNAFIGAGLVFAGVWLMHHKTDPIPPEG
jgi:drug/metabolite transporter (DMT)-like permease